MPVYYPSMVMNIRLRFDEAVQVQITSQQPPAKSAKDLVDAPTTPAQVTYLPLILEGQKDQLSWVMGRIPKTASVDLSGYRQAGKFSCTFDFRDLPFDPRIIRAIGVEIHLGVVEAGAFGQGMVRSNPDGSRSSVLITRDEAGRPLQSTMIMVGTVDEHKVSHDEKSSTITLEGRDLRGVLLDSPVDPAIWENIDPTQTIVEVVAAVVAKHPLGSTIHTETRSDDWDGGIVPSPVGALGALARTGKGASGKKATISPPGDKNKQNYWDVITYLCTLVAAIPFFEGEILYIRPSRSLYDLERKETNDPSKKTPFKDAQPRTVSGQTAPLTFRRMVYGDQVRSLSFTRKLGGVKARPVQVQGYDASQKGQEKLVSVIWPVPTPGGVGTATKAKTTSVAPSGKAAQEDILRTPPIYGITDKDALLEIARGVYEEVGRQELGGSCDTKALASFGGSNSDPDLLRLKPGDPVEFLVNQRALGSRSPLVAQLINDVRVDEAEAIRQLTERIGDGQLARVAVLTSRGLLIGLGNTFRTSSVSFSWDASSGVGISFEFQNYVEARSNVGGLPTPAPPALDKEGNEITLSV